MPRSARRRGQAPLLSARGEGDVELQVNQGGIPDTRRGDRVARRSRSHSCCKCGATPLKFRGSGRPGSTAWPREVVAHMHGIKAIRCTADLFRSDGAGDDVNPTRWGARSRGAWYVDKPGERRRLWLRADAARADNARHEAR